MRERLCTLQNEHIKIRIINRNESTSTPESIKERALKLRHIDLLSDILKIRAACKSLNFNIHPQDHSI